MSDATKISASEARIAKGISIFRSEFFSPIGLIMAANPIITRKLKMLLPITFPIAMPGALSRLAIMLTDNSGADVPIETTVRPIIRSETLSLLAIEEAPLTR